MRTHLPAHPPVARLLAVGAGIAVGAWAAVAGTAWRRFGHAPAGSAEEYDDLLDRFIPEYDVVERHHIRVAAPAAVTLAAAKEQDFQQIPAIRAIFKTRELVLRGKPVETPDTRLLAQVHAFGWGILAETPGREVVVGAVTKPWDPNPTFRALPPSAIRSLQRARLREDRVDPARGPDWRSPLDVPDGDARGRHGRDLPGEVQALLGLRLARSCRYSQAVTAATQT